LRSRNKLKNLSGKAEKLRELNAHFAKVREVLGTAKNAKDARRGLRRLRLKWRGR
jgi:hypothetical protein